MCSRVRAILNKNGLLIKTHNRAPWFPHFFVNFLKDIEKCNLMACVFAYLCNLVGQEFLPNLSTEGEKFKSCEYQFFKRPPVQVKHIFLEISPDQAMKGLSSAERGNDLSEGRRSTISQESLFVFRTDCRGFRMHLSQDHWVLRLRDSDSLKLRLLGWENGVFRVTMIDIALNGAGREYASGGCWG